MLGAWNCFYNRPGQLTMWKDAKVPSRIHSKFYSNRWSDQGLRYHLRNIFPYPSNTTSLLRTPGKVGRSHSQSVQSVPGYHACASMTRLYSSKVALRIFLVTDLVDNPWHLQRNTYSKWWPNNLKSHRKFWDLESHCSIQYPTLKRWWANGHACDKP